MARRPADPHEGEAPIEAGVRRVATDGRTRSQGIVSLAPSTPTVTVGGCRFESSEDAVESTDAQGQSFSAVLLRGCLSCVVEAAATFGYLTARLGGSRTGSQEVESALAKLDATGDKVLALVVRRWAEQLRVAG